jgi:hypothetical protein
MSDADDLEPYEAFVATAERLQEDGFSLDAIIDGSFMLAFQMVTTLYGPAAVADRLEALKRWFARDAAEGTDGSAHCGG